MDMNHVAEILSQILGQVSNLNSEDGKTGEYLQVTFKS